jgi:hypothetical protein
MLPVRFTTRLKKGDFVKAYFCQIFVSRKYWARIFLVFLILAAVIKFSSRPHPVWYAYALCGIPILAIILLTVIIGFIRVNKSLHDQNYFKVINWEVNFESISRKADSFEDKITKEDLRKIRETSGWFFLENKNSSTVFIPKKDISIDRLKLLRMIFKHKFTPA